MIEQFKLYYVTNLPISLDEGLLYVSRKYGISGHLCPCGCGNKIITPLGKTEWKLKVIKGKPSLYPSIGNWQLRCKSHYWILKGKVVWSYMWTDEQIKAGQETENCRRVEYYSKHGGSNIIERIRKYFRFI